ncbi:hypothetical protein Tco_1514500 [Tanacetum coccineum]
MSSRSPNTRLQFGRLAFIKRGRWNIRNYGSPRLTGFLFVSRYRLKNLDFATGNISLRFPNVFCCDPQALVDGFIPIEDNIGLLETKFNEEAIFVFVFLKDVTGSVNLTLLSLFFGVIATNFSPELLILKVVHFRSKLDSFNFKYFDSNDVVPQPIPFDERHFGLQKVHQSILIEQSVEQVLQRLLTNGIISPQNKLLWIDQSLEHWNTRTIRPESGWENLEVLMIDYLSIVETDKVIHTVETDMVKHVIEIESFGMSFDEFYKETGSSDGL